MSEPEIVIVENAAAVAAEAAARFIAVSELGQPFTVALAGGSTPKAMYELLSGELAERVAWGHCSLYFGDERCVPPEHADSNFRMVKEALIDPLALRRFHPKSVARMEGEREPQSAATHYADLLRDVGDPPSFDLVLLGMGADGHTASLFPGTAALSERSATVAANFVAKLDTYRLTLTYPVLAAAKRIVVLVAGPEKAAVLPLAIRGAPGTVPLRDLRPRRSPSGAQTGTMAFICDRAAAKDS